MKNRIPLLLLLLLGACAAPNPWMHPQLPKDQWSRDYSACRRSADRDSGYREDSRDTYSPTREYERAQAKRIYDSELNACMRSLGYFPTPKN
ncbi:hypothetical protein CCC_00149 [Paramagnetospirillum magnetotacticum MS-1]|uniref:Lipoprotein n=1 Tax=Paramagnetospirillum magnetotacticum MS-1 TaxID=272627 RepID=A0A0C2YPR7_PARME|nr:hypothetical protein [Paramagnetospirillum magnetotacticum]KIL97088.1 hypothetical protein CCC_00149 [Paramagnetospirillum magnetotacticum MS-1]